MKMKKRLGQAVLGVLLAVMLLAGCSGGNAGTGDAEATREITDAAGRVVTIPSEVKKVAPLGVGALRYILYDGGVNQLAGVEQNDLDVPVTKAASYAYQEELKKLPVIGDIGTPYEEELMKAAPDVIITSNDGKAADDLQNKTGIPVVTMPITDKVFDDEIYNALNLVGDVLGKQERSQEVVDYMKSVAEELKSRTENIPKDKIPTAYCGAVSFKGAHGIEGTEAGYPPFSALGITNVADETGKKGAFDVDLEQILKWNSDYLFLDAGNLKLVNDDYAVRPDFYNELKAVQDKKVYSQVAYRFNGTYTELALANAYYVGTVVYPEAFADVDITKKTDEITEKMLGVPYSQKLKDAGLNFRQITLGE